MKHLYKTKHFLIILSLITGIGFSVTGNTSDALNSTTIEGEHFRVSYKSNISPLPLNRIHSWTLHIDTLSGQTVENATITIRGGMPAHKHGLPTQPEITETGGGNYYIEGLKFSMTGKWQIWFIIHTENFTDKIKFDITL